MPVAAPSPLIVESAAAAAGAAALPQVAAEVARQPAAKPAQLDQILPGAAAVVRPADTRSSTADPEYQVVLLRPFPPHARLPS